MHYTDCDQPYLKNASHHVRKTQNLTTFILNTAQTTDPIDGKQLELATGVEYVVSPDYRLNAHSREEQANLLYKMNSKRTMKQPPHHHSGT